MTRREKFRSLRSFALYYGRGEADRLARYDVAVVEPKGQSPGDLKKLQASGTLVVAYVSVMEVASYDPELAWLKEDDFLRIDGERARNDEYGTTLVSLSSARWRGLVHHRIGTLLLRDGYDGIFLDTIGNVEWETLGDRTTSERAAAVGLVRELREAFPSHVFIQNNGVVRLFTDTARYVDAVCWENPPFHLPQTRDWAERLAERIGEEAKSYGCSVLLLAEQGLDRSPLAAEKVDEVASRLGFASYRAPHRYLSLPEE
jgi:endo-alpha-1,4-polygalactosaminidase (GH114 family)